jgi:hypothetical protein
MIIGGCRHAGLIAKALVLLELMFDLPASFGLRLGLHPAHAEARRVGNKYHLYAWGPALLLMYARAWLSELGN